MLSYYFDVANEQFNEHKCIFSSLIMFFIAGKKVQLETPLHNYFLRSSLQPFTGFLLRFNLFYRINFHFISHKTLISMKTNVWYWIKLRQFNQARLIENVTFTCRHSAWGSATNRWKTQNNVTFTRFLFISISISHESISILLKYFFRINKDGINIFPLPNVLFIFNWP